MECRFKVKYETKGQAKKSWRVAKAKYKKELQAYKCSECPYYHLHSWDIAKKKKYRATKRHNERKKTYISKNKGW